MKKFFKKYPKNQDFIEKVDIVAFVAFKYIVLGAISIVAAFLVLNVAVQIFVQKVVVPLL